MCPAARGEGGSALRAEAVERAFDHARAEQLIATADVLIENWAAISEVPEAPDAPHA